MACGACPGAEHIVVKALNPIGAEVGQHVKFEVREVNIVIGAFVCFIMPLIVAGLGADAGHWIGLSQAIDAMQAVDVGCTVGCLNGVDG
ncbi:SoxR reducing system RseC family protein, partial [Megasphaera stantonii]|uniref:SoxR reducing system RseC family protein n=1 Tax=Megasphaera stantonii TaxID=2144175 RepID=UPI001E47BFB3